MLLLLSVAHLVNGKDLGKDVCAKLDLIGSVGWHGLVRKIQPRGEVKVVHESLRGHSADDFLTRVGTNGVPVVFHTKHWDDATISEPIERGSHLSCEPYMDFLREELTDFSNKGYWVVLPAAKVLERLANGTLADL